ncbi:MAG: hypothetical protein ABIO43_13170 [Sphingomicrobium sp.]
MMKLLFALPLLCIAAPVSATGGLVCRTGGARPVEVSVGFGHVPGSPLILTRLRDAGRTVPVTWAQWWLDDAEVRLLLIDPQARSQQLLLKAKRNGTVYEGALWRGGKRRWVRCRED